MAMEEDGERYTVASISSSAVNSWWACMSDSGDLNNANQPWRLPTSVHNINGNNRSINRDPSLFSSSSEQDQMCVNSLTNNASNRTPLGVDSQEMRVDPNTHMDLSLEPATDNHIWSQVFVGTVGRNSELAENQDDGTKLLGALPNYKGMRSELMLEGACDQMERPENWEFPSYSGGFDPENLNYLVTKCSLSAPNGSQFQQNLIDRSTFSPSLFLHLDRNLAPIGPRTDQMEHSSPSSSSYSDGSSVAGSEMRRHSGFMPPVMHNLRERKQVDAYNTSILPQAGERSDWHNVKNVADFIHFGGGLNKPLLDFQASKTMRGSAELQSCKRYFPETSISVSRGLAKEKGGNSNEGKKKREDEPNYAASKKHKQEGSSIPTSKLQVSKVKLGDRITALQQIVAPFGKTDTASVLLEAITYIKFMQEQVALLLNHPYVKPSQSKRPDYNLSWRGGSSSEQQEGESKLENLRSRGLCLIPISCTPQVCRENTGVDYWAPTYRGCLYR